MKTQHSKHLVLFLLAIAGLIFSFTFKKSVMQDKKPWPVPETAMKMKNPVKNDAEAITLGKTLYAKHCKSCHGKKGEGDGTKAAELKTAPGDFTLKEFQIQPDGELFYKIREGREDFPSFKKKIPEADDIWSIVHYLRTLKAE